MTARVKRQEVAAGNPGGTLRRVTVSTPYQVVHDGQVFTPGQTAEVPAEIAAEWVAAGWVREA